MRYSSKIILKGLIEKCPDEKRYALAKFIPKDELETFIDVPSPHFDLTHEKFFHDGLLEFVHYSWYIPTLKSYPQGDTSFFLSSLNSSYQKRLSSMLKLPLSRQKLSAFAKNYPRKVLLASLLGKEESLLPVDYLPESPVNMLLDFSKEQLVRIIDSLALYDLAIELRQIVETKLLRKIYSCLSEDEVKFVSSKANYKETFSFPRLGLEKWDGTCKTLKTLLHKRGLNRFAKGLSMSHEDLIWYISHRLDIGRGNSLFKLCKKKMADEIATAIMANILEVASLIQNNQPLK